MFNLSVYSAVLFVHVASGVALIGSSLFAPLTRKQIVDATSPGELQIALALARQAIRFNPAFALVLLATGLYMGSLGWWRQPWFLVAFSGWWLNFLLAKLVVKPSAVAVARAAFQEGEGLSERVDRLRRSAAWTIAARAMLGTDFALLFLMLNKPGAAGSLTVLVGAIALLVAPCAWRVAARQRGTRHTLEGATAAG